MSFILPILVLITPFIYVLSPYAFVLLLVVEAWLYIRNVDGFGNRFLLLLLFTVMYSCISIAGIRLYDVVILIAFIITGIRKKGHIVLKFNIFPFLFLVAFVGILHNGRGSLSEIIRYIICILLFITTYNNEYDFKKIEIKLVNISVANLYFAVMVFLLNAIGRIKQYVGIVASNIYVNSSTSEIRLNGFFSDPNKHMAFCFALIFIVEIWLQEGKQKKIILIILYISSLISLSRTAILSLLAYLFFKIIKTSFRRDKVLSVVLGTVILLAIILFVLSPEILNNLVNFMYVTSAKLMGREHTLSINANLQSDNRTIIWKRAFGLIKEHPILGYGWNSIRELLPYPTHNTVFELLMDSGVIGLCCYLIFMKKLLFNKYYEYTIPFVWIPMLFLDLGGYRILFLLLGLIYSNCQTNVLLTKDTKT